MNNAENGRQHMAAIITEAKTLLKTRQKLIKIADRNKNGWKVVEDYESDDLASNSEVERKLKQAKEAASRKRKPDVFQPVGPIKRQCFGTNTVKSYTNCFSSSWDTLYTLLVWILWESNHQLLVLSAFFQG